MEAAMAAEGARGLSRPGLALDRACLRVPNAARLCRLQRVLAPARTSRMRVRAASASGAASHPSSSPDIWSNMVHAAGSAMGEAHAATLEMKSRLRHTISSSVVGLMTFTDPEELRERATEFAGTMNGRWEEVAFDARQEMTRLDATYRFSARLEGAVSAVEGAASTIDCKYQVRQNVRKLQWEAAYHWTLANRRMVYLKRSPAFPFLVGMFFAWLLLSGWLLRLLFWTMWILPFFPLVARSVLRVSLVEGNCSGCGHHFMGSKQSRLCCPNCQKVVWQPKSKGGKKDNDSSTSRQPARPVIIDVPRTA